MGVMRRYLAFVKPYRWKIIGTFIIGIIKFAIPLMIPFLMKYVIDDVIDAEGLTAGEKTKSLMMTMGMMLFIICCRQATGRILSPIFCTMDGK